QTGPGRWGIGSGHTLPPLCSLLCTESDNTFEQTASGGGAKSGHAGCSTDWLCGYCRRREVGTPREIGKRSELSQRIYTCSQRVMRNGCRLARDDTPDPSVKRAQTLSSPGRGRVTFAGGAAWPWRVTDLSMVVGEGLPSPAPAVTILLLATRCSPLGARH